MGGRTGREHEMPRSVADDEVPSEVPSVGQQLEAIQEGVREAFTENMGYVLGGPTFGQQILRAVQDGVRQAFTEYLEKHGLPSRSRT